MYGAGDEARTRDLNLGKVALYQLSYSRIVLLLPAYYLLTAALFLQLLSYCHRRFELRASEKRDYGETTETCQPPFANLFC